MMSRGGGDRGIGVGLCEMEYELACSTFHIFTDHPSEYLSSLMRESAQQHTVPKLAVGYLHPMAIGLERHMDDKRMYPQILY